MISIPENDEGEAYQQRLKLAIELACCHLAFITAFKRINNVASGAEFKTIETLLVTKLIGTMNVVHVNLTRKTAAICQELHIPLHEYRDATNHARHVEPGQRANVAVDSPFFKRLLNDVINSIRSVHPKIDQQHPHPGPWLSTVTPPEETDDMADSAVSWINTHASMSKNELGPQPVGDIAEQLANLIITQSVMEI